MTGDPLEQLRDWHLPAPIDWWPPAPGWWVLAALLLVCIPVLRALVAGRRRRSRAGDAVRSALRELAALQAALHSGGDVRGYAAAVSRLLRRVALARYPRERVAGLTGDAWLAFLDETGGGAGFRDGPGRVLVDLAYGPGADGQSSLDPDALAALAATWIRAVRGPTGRAASPVDAAPVARRVEDAGSAVTIFAPRSADGRRAS